MSLICPLCLSGATKLFEVLDVKEYHNCTTCQCTFLDPKHFLTPPQEEAHYHNHQNNPEDTGYRTFLEKLSKPLRKHLTPGMRGLDYGCGPGPALTMMLEDAGYAMSLYDPFFYPDKNALHSKYDFITCTETVEHFHSPAKEFEHFAKLLSPGGVLGVMTSFLTDDQTFATWPYRLDPTHVIFYRVETFSYLAHKHKWNIDIPCKDVVIFQNP